MCGTAPPSSGVAENTCDVNGSPQPARSIEITTNLQDMIALSL
jgi:hypothetical protein